MDRSTLGDFRQALYPCFTRARDALFEVADALLTAGPARSFVELSEAPTCRRRWPSLYAALADGRIDRDALRRHFAQRVPRPPPGERLVLGVDCSSIQRPAAHTAPDRTLVHTPNLPAGAPPVRPGWQFSTLAVLPDPPSSWTYLLDNRRVPSAATAAAIGAQQLAALLPLLPARPIVVGDGHYGSAAWVAATAGLGCDQLLRARRDRVLYRPAPPRTGKRGAPKKDGPRFKGSDARTHGAPDVAWTGVDEAGRPASVACWTGLHLQACREVPIAVICVSRAGAAGTPRDPREAWFWWLGGAPPPPGTVAPLYARRFGLEQGYRLDKQELLWAAPRLRTPERFQRWTDLVAVAHNQLVLARPLVAVAHRPWEAKTRPVTPAQVRRAMGRILPQVGTPARPPRPRGKSPGRAAGAIVKRATRHPVIRKDHRRGKRRAA
jgi:DDE superfamily endonuclease